MPAIARFRNRFLRKLVLGAGWIAFVLVLLLTAFERSGLLADMLRKELRGHLGALPLELEGAQLAWFDTRIDLVGLRIGEGEGSVQVDRLEVHWGLGLQEGLGIRGLVLRGGRARITPDFVRALETRVGDQPATPTGFTLPPLVVRDMKVEVLSERWQGFGLGSVDLRAQSQGGGIEAEGALHLNVGEVYLHGTLGADRQLRLETLATGLPVSKAYLPEQAHDFQPQGSLALEGHVGADLRPEGRASGTLRLSLSEGSLYVAHGTQRVDHLALEFDGHVETEDVGMALDPGAWECALKASGTWEQHRFEGWGFLGPALAAGARARGFVHLPALPLDGSIVELIATEPLERAKLEARWKAFTPRGEVELWASFELPEPPPGVPAALADLRLCAEARMDGKAGLSYQGWPQENGQRDAGFPLPLEELHGAVVFARDPKAKRANLLGLVDLSGNSVCGPLRAQGLVHSHASDDPPLMPGYNSSEFELHFQAAKLLHNAAFEEALAGLGRAVPAESTWRPYQPQGGTVGIELRLSRKVDMQFAACDLLLALEGLGLRWDDLPVRLSAAHGELRFRSDGKGERGLAARFDAQLPSRDALLGVQLRYQTAPWEPQGPEGKTLDQLSCVEAQVTGLSLTGDEKQVLVKAYPDLDTALERMSPRGFADIELERVQSGARAPARWRGELTPRDVLLQPQNFRVNTSKVRGRVILVSPGIDQMAFAGRLPGTYVDLWAAGIHPDDKNVRGALGEGANKFDLSGFGLLGPLDLSGRILLAAAQAEGFGLEAQIFLRDNTFRTEPHPLVLKDMRGRLELKEGVLRGPELHAVLGRTAVVLRNLEFRTPGERFELGLELESRGLPLDREHLAGFVDEKTLAALLDDMHLEGPRARRDPGPVDQRQPVRVPGRRPAAGHLDPARTALGHPLRAGLDRPAAARGRTAARDGARARPRRHAGRSCAVAGQHAADLHRAAALDRGPGGGARGRQALLARCRGAAQRHGLLDRPRAALRLPARARPRRRGHRPPAARHVRLGFRGQGQPERAAAAARQHRERARRRGLGLGRRQRVASVVDPGLPRAVLADRAEERGHLQAHVRQLARSRGPPGAERHRREQPARDAARRARLDRRRRRHALRPRAALRHRGLARRARAPGLLDPEPAALGLDPRRHGPALGGAEEPLLGSVRRREAQARAAAAALHAASRALLIRRESTLRA